MKKAKLTMIVMALCLGLTATLSSCSDNNDSPSLPAAKQIAGTYNGDMTCNVMTTTLQYEALTVTIKATDDATAVVTIPSFGGNGHNTLPSFDIPGVKVSGDDGKYLIATTEFSGTNKAGQAYSGTLHGNITDGTLTLEFTLHIGAMPMPMNCVFISSGN